jgi:uncharacterized protein with von Willebrand factor type A (vWA) domain
MNEMKLDPIVARMTILRKDTQTGHVYVASIFKNDGGKKKNTKLLRPVEKLVRRLGKAQAKSASIYSERHERSSRKKKNGWLFDMVSNMRKAQSQGWKASKRSKSE